MALITGYKYLPSLEDQIEAARAWGIPDLTVDGKSFPSVLVDDVSNKRSTNWASLLKRRQRLIAYFEAYQSPQVHVFFADPLCLGWTENLASELINGIFAGDAVIYIHETGQSYRIGDDLEALWKDWARRLKNAQQAEFRRKARKAA
ncbi:hypothetical protein GCM10007094_41280 [Pseudovibrio japonicus]|uniref:Resolvase/invertase-type recombinase catalytic domain-containing protein n=1 Tax=Pseudovibrio japonicus TaxID=366534 RepID=A0ABQ3EPZ7_9HYPH|nr:hypothetical protein [Pseudovibrio japonicus]GHB47733.1 hypothetical protein GCM10007094_41280 [Pseudovibrio japonicus]